MSTETTQSVGWPTSVPGRFNLSRDLIVNMASYVLPLIGILAAVSYDVSDLLHTWLDPVFRILS